LAGQPRPEVYDDTMEGWDGYAASRQRIPQSWV
jgi:hypothetical protein